MPPFMLFMLPFSTVTFSLGNKDCSLSLLLLPAYESYPLYSSSLFCDTFGMLKMHGTLPYNPQRVSAVFVACCVLHNMTMHHGCDIDLREETENLRQRRAELHVPCVAEGGDAQEAWECYRNSFTSIVRMQNIENVTLFQIKKCI